MVTEQLEIERTFEADDDFVLPALSIVDGVAEQSAAEQFELASTYFDTADLRLAAAGVTLRRRTGGPDEGWHLKVPVAPEERRELRAPLGAGARVPAALSRQVRVHVRGQRLAPVATIRTLRVVRRLLGGKGRVLVEVCDDHASATSPDGDPGRWREIEVELVDGDRDLLDAVGGRLIESGARPASSSSKLARTLGPRLPVGAASITGSSAGAVVTRYLAEQVAHLTGCDPAVREDAHDAVHQMRVATRRLRSTLATYRPLFDPDVTDPIRDELRWLGGVLGPARDLEVVRDRLGGLLVEDDVADRGVRALVDRDLASRRREARRQLLTELDGVRYFRLLDTLDALVSSPPLSDTAQRGAEKVLPGLVRRSWKRLRRARDAAAEPELTEAERGLRLHEARKKAKQARYAAEAVSARFGKPATQFAARMKKVQSVLGHVQDSVVSAAELSRQAGGADDSFAFGRAQVLEEERGRQSLARFESVWAKASAPKLRRWLR